MKIYQLFSSKSNADQICENQIKHSAADVARAILDIYQQAEDQHSIDSNPYTDQQLLIKLKQQPGFEHAVQKHVYVGLSHIARTIKPILRPHGPAPFPGYRDNIPDSWTRVQFKPEKFFDPIFTERTNEIIDFARNGVGNIEIADEVDAPSQKVIANHLSIAQLRYGIHIPPQRPAEEKTLIGQSQTGQILILLARGRSVPDIARIIDRPVGLVSAVISRYFQSQLDQQAQQLGVRRSQLTAQQRMAAMAPLLRRIKDLNPRSGSTG